MSSDHTYSNQVMATQGREDGGGVDLQPSGCPVHPLDRPAAKVAWFSERICGKKRYPVSFISDEISAPDNVIHKGETFHVTPAQVNLLDAQSL